MALDEKFPLALPQGTILAGQYVIEQTLGQGGFGITYKATDHKTGQSVAVKEFFPDTMASRTTPTTVTAFPGERGESFAYGKGCFLQEAETLAEFIGNDNIVRIYSYFEENGTAYFVMELIEGTSFDRYIKENGGKVPYEEAEKILLPIIDALAIVHAKGIVHRDVTPDNIYITKDGGIKLLDFGAARYSLGDKSRSLDVVLKHGFAPKEQYTRHGRQGPYTDVYTVGASFYFAITGRRPPDSIERLEEDELIPPSRMGVEIAPGKEDAILMAMSVQPSNRYQTMEEFRQALTASENAAQPSPSPQESVPQSPSVEPQPAPSQQPQNSEPQQDVSPQEVKDAVIDKIRIVMFFAVLGAVAGVVMQLLIMFDFINYSEELTAAFRGAYLMLAGANVALACLRKLKAAHKTQKKGERVNKIARIVLCESVMVSFSEFCLGGLIDYWLWKVWQKHEFFSLSVHEVWGLWNIIFIFIRFVAIISLVVTVISGIVMIADKGKNK